MGGRGTRPEPGTPGRPVPQAFCPAGRRRAAVRGQLPALPSGGGAFRPGRPAPEKPRHRAARLLQLSGAGKRRLVPCRRPHAGRTRPAGRGPAGRAEGRRPRHSPQTAQTGPDDSGHLLRCWKKRAHGGPVPHFSSGRPPGGPVQGAEHGPQLRRNRAGGGNGPRPDGAGPGLPHRPGCQDESHPAQAPFQHRLPGDRDGACRRPHGGAGIFYGQKALLAGRAPGVRFPGGRV